MDNTATFPVGDWFTNFPLNTPLNTEEVSFWHPAAFEASHARVRSLTRRQLNSLAAAPYMPQPLHLTTTTPEGDAVSYVTSDEYADLPSPDVLPLPKTEDSPMSFRESSASATGSPGHHQMFCDQFGAIPQELLYPQAQDMSAVGSSPASSILPQSAMMPTPTTTTATTTAAAAASASVATMAAAMSSLPSPQTGESSATSPTTETSSTSVSSAQATTATTAANGKPRRKRQNRYQNASEELMQRRRDQNRHSQRAYRERKDQKIRDLEAKALKQDKLISELRAEIRNHRCMPALAAPPFHQQPLPPTPAPMAYTHGPPFHQAFAMHTNTVLRPAPPLPSTPMGPIHHGTTGMYTLPNGAPRSF